MRGADVWRTMCKRVYDLKMKKADDLDPVILALVDLVREPTPLVASLRKSGEQMRDDTPTRSDSHTASHTATSAGHFDGHHCRGAYR